MRKGLYREDDKAFINWGATEAKPFLTRDSYTANGYEPPFHELPTREEYEHRNGQGS